MCTIDENFYVQRTELFFEVELKLRNHVRLMLHKTGLISDVLLHTL